MNRNGHMAMQQYDGIMSKLNIGGFISYGMKTKKWGENGDYY